MQQNEEWIAAQIADELNIRKEQVTAVADLLDEGCTVPFIARYRKEVHGGLDDGVLRKLYERLGELRSLNEKKQTALNAMEKLGVLTPELSAQMASARTAAEVEDIYRPYRQKRRTRASIAKERGLEGLAVWIAQNHYPAGLSAEAQKYVSEDKGVVSAADALAGASDILAEKAADRADFRAVIKNLISRQGSVVSEIRPVRTAADGKTPAAKAGKEADGADRTAAAAAELDPEGKYEMYYHFRTEVQKVSDHQILAMHRAENEKVISVHLDMPDETIVNLMKFRTERAAKGDGAAFLENCIRDAWKRLIAPSVEREILSALLDRALDGAVRVFGSNLRQLLMQPPIAGQVVLGWDPGYAHGCKLAVIDEYGKPLDTTVVYPRFDKDGDPSKTRENGSIRVLKDWIRKYHVTLISIGNGTASRQSEELIASAIREEHLPVQYIITNEAGASVYSASEQGAKELPDYDVEGRSSISIARRVQDPLAELVKISPEAIGVGQYQHDCDPVKLSETLNGVVEDCVNEVGVDLNTASAALLSHVSGISGAVAANIVDYREKNGAYTDRSELKKVPRLGPKAFEQSAGFLRIRDGKNPLDATAVHPESYPAARALLDRLGVKEEMIGTEQVKGIGKRVDIHRMSEELGIGEMTLADIVSELEKPSRDPRDEMPKPLLRSDVMQMEDLKPDMILKGTVRNVVDFGAFVDIGVHQDGLVHITEMPGRPSSPHKVVKVGDVITVRVKSCDLRRKRIALSMKNIPAGSAAGPD